MTNHYWQWRKFISSGLNLMPPLHYQGTLGYSKFCLLMLNEEKEITLRVVFLQALENSGSPPCFSDYPALERAASLYRGFSIAFFLNHSRQTVENFSTLRLSFFVPWCSQCSCRIIIPSIKQNFLDTQLWWLISCVCLSGDWLPRLNIVSGCVCEGVSA